MLVIREAQISTLRQRQFGLFLERAKERAGRLWPKLPNATLSAVIEEALGRAAAYRIVTERDLVLYGDVALTFGPCFDHDPELPWAAEVLKSAANPAVKVARLYAQAIEQQHQANGAAHRPAALHA